MTALKFGGSGFSRCNVTSQSAVSRYFVFAVVAVVALLYWPATVETLGKWQTSITYSHGYLLAPIAIWFASAVPAGKKPFASKLPLSIIVLTIGFGAVWFGGYLANVKIVQVLALPALIWCGLSLVFGRQLAPGFIVPVGLLLFGVPLWDYGNFALQDLTTFVVGDLLDLFHRPAVIDGNFVHVRAGTFEIASGCSGLHFFIVALVLAVIFGHQHLGKVTNRIRLIVLAAILALTANWLRVFLVILAGDLTDMQHFLVTEGHYYFGWIVFLLVFAPFFLYARHLSAAELQRQPNSAASTREHVTDAHQQDAGGPRLRPMLRCGIILAVLATWPMLAYAMTVRDFSHAVSPIRMPDDISSWMRIEDDQPAAGWSPLFVGASEEYLGTFSDGMQNIDIYLNLYASESQGNELVGYENSWYDKTTWHLSQSQIVEVADGENRGDWRLLYIQTGGRSRVVIASYVIGDRFLANETGAKIAGLVDRIDGSALSGAIAASAECVSSCKMETQRVEEFIKSGSPIFRAALADSLAKRAEL